MAILDVKLFEVDVKIMMEGREGDQARFFMWICTGFTGAYVTNVMEGREGKKGRGGDQLGFGDLLTIISHK